MRLVSLSSVLAFAIFSPLALAKGMAPANITRFETRLPLVHVQTKTATVTKDEVEARITVLDNGKNSSVELLRTKPQYSGRVKVRGYSSAKMSKKQYGLEFTDEQGNEAEIPFLGLPAHEKWVLGAPYVDRALLRNKLAFTLASSLQVGGQPWYAPRTRNFELFLNGKYQGVYLLTEKVDRSKNRLNLGKINRSAPEQSPFLIQVERDPRAAADEYFWSDDKADSQVHYVEPKAKKLNELAKSDPALHKRISAHIQDRYNEFEVAIRAIEKGDTRTYRSMVNAESFANFILIQEIFKNLDGYRRSLNLHWKDGRFYMGPVWDFDLTMGGIWVFRQRSTRGFQVGHGWYIDSNPELFWFKTMLKDPSFHNAVVKRYRYLRRAGQPLSTGNIMRQIDAMSGEIRLSGADRRNFTVWDPNGRGLRRDGPLWLFVPKYSNFTYGGVVLELKKWTLKRLEWLDEHFDEIGR